MSFTSHDGVSFVNQTTAETASAVTSDSISGTDLIAYNVTWTIDPVPVDSIYFNYDADFPGANYFDTDQSPCVFLESQSIELVNCVPGITNGILDPDTLANIVDPQDLNIYLIDPAE